MQKILFLTFILLLIFSFFFYPKLDDGDFINRMREALEGFGIWAPLVFLAIYIIVTIFVPSTSFMVAAGILFGFKFGLIYTIIGGFISAMLVFYISRKLGKDLTDSALRSKYMKYLEKYNSRLEREGFLDLIVLRAMPIMPFNVLNILMGVSKISTTNYIIGTLIGLVPSNVFAVYLGTFVAKLF